MSIADLGHILVIANPASRSGMGAEAAEVVRRVLDAYGSSVISYELLLTTAPGDATHMASGATGFDTVIALGGDGVIHEVANGLMALSKEERPRLGIVPMGSGNDFARTLGTTFNDAEAALRELLSGGERTIDVGFVRSDQCPEGVYYIQTLSFGLDAAIALDTIDKRADGTWQRGTTLFVTSALKTFSHARKGYIAKARLDGEEVPPLEEIVFAVQNGPTYGGGFRICPDATPNDGMLDVCFNVKHPNVAHLLALLGRARFGRHTGSPALCLRTARRIEVDFLQKEPPCQVDGERFTGTHYEICAIPAALRVIVPPACPW